MMCDVGCVMSDGSWVSFVDGLCAGMESRRLTIASILNGDPGVHGIVVLMRAQNHCRPRLLTTIPRSQTSVEFTPDRETRN